MSERRAGRAVRFHLPLVDLDRAEKGENKTVRGRSEARSVRKVRLAQQLNCLSAFIAVAAINDNDKPFKCCAGNTDVYLLLKRSLINFMLF